MRRRFTAVPCLLIGLLGLASYARAQTITTGALSGTITNAAGVPLADVSITVTSAEGGASRSVVTEHDGEFRLGLLLPGDYDVLVERLGYRPKVIERVPVRSSRASQVDVSIVPSPPPIEAPERIRFTGDPGGSRPGVSQAVSALSFDRLPWERRETSELAGLTSASTESLQTEGLPGWLSTVTVDGLRYIPARHPLLGRNLQREIALPVSALQSAELITADADAEWYGFAGGTLAVNTRRGASEFSLESFGAWSGGGLHNSKFIEGGDVANNSLWGGVLLSGPIKRDTAHFVLGLEARKLDTPLSQAWQRDETVEAALVDVGRTAFDVELEPFRRPFLLQSNVISGFGRFDWQLANHNALSLRFGYGHISPAKGAVDIAAATLPEMVGSGNDLLLTASLTTRVAGKWSHEVRGGLIRSTREYESEIGVGTAVLPGTRIVAGALSFGSDSRLPGLFRRTEVLLDQSLQIPGATHELKLGISAGATWHDDSFTYASGGQFSFSDPAAFGQSNGVFLESSLDGASDLKFSVVKLGAFIQDVWHAGPGLHVTAGVRYDIASLPKDDITPNQEWLLATGLANDDIEDRVGTFSPRFNLTWDAGGWVVSATAGRYANDVDGTLLDELLLGDGDLRIRRALGDLGGWPTPSASLPASRTTLTLLGRGFRPPQTDRASFGMSTRIGAATLQLSGTYRKTDFLPRRSDLNLFTTPAARDQHGRPIFGSLVQLGEMLVVAQPNRRFTDFDLVSALAADGWSRYWGVTAAVEHNASQALSFFATYTHSRTTDNWLVGGAGGGPQSQLSPFPDDLTDDWREGTSDFDLPDRLSAGVEIRPASSLQPRLTATYRFRSGYPYTPGFNDGVDANGDGSDRNDPAFVDDDITGAAAVIGANDCLRDQVGRFAERNACREPSVHSLNVRLGLTLLRSARTSAEFFVDGINLVESSQAEPDRALYLVDRNGTLVVNQDQGTITTPLIVNPHFGRPLVRFGTGRLLRIGLQVNH